MRLPKEDSERLKTLLDENPSMPKSEFVEAYARYYKPDALKLIHQDVNRKATAFIARQIGEDGIRKAFIVGPKDDPKVVNIENVKKLSDADAVVSHLQNAVDSRLPGLKKALKKRNDIAGQMNLLELVH